ncbi:MAG TPA: Fic family protein [Blastocatellia bacterium]|nr:Fic family protein [Blastocatellia bacterium]
MELPVFANNLRSSASWKEILDAAHEQWKEATASALNRERLESRVRLLQLLHTLGRAGKFVDEREAALLALQPPDSLNQSEPAGFIRAAKLVSSSATDAEAKLTLELLTDIYRTLAGTAPDADVIRKTESLALNPAHSPAPAILLPQLIDNALDWFTTGGFGELHVVEKAALVYLRLLDLQPFPTHHEQVALLAASFYVERAGLPPLVIFADEPGASRYPAVIESAFRLLTQPLVEFMAENLTRTIQTVVQ